MEEKKEISFYYIHIISLVLKHKCYVSSPGNSWNPSWVSSTETVLRLFLQGDVLTPPHFQNWLLQSQGTQAWSWSWRACQYSFGFTPKLQKPREISTHKSQASIPLELASRNSALSLATLKPLNGAATMLWLPKTGIYMGVCSFYLMIKTTNAIFKISIFTRGWLERWNVSVETKSS